MTLSMKLAKDNLASGDMNEIMQNLGFITTVFRDNEMDDEMHKYFEVVLNYILRTEKQRFIPSDKFAYNYGVQVLIEKYDELEKQAKETGKESDEMGMLQAFLSDLNIANWDYDESGNLRITTTD